MNMREDTNTGTNALRMRRSAMGLLTGLILIGAALSATGEGAGNMGTNEKAYDPIRRIVHHTQGWGKMGENTCAHASDIEPMRLQIGDTEYDHGIGDHAPSETTIHLGGQFLRFEAEVGVQRQDQNAGSVKFRVLVDEKTAFESDILREDDPAMPVSVDLRGAEELVLVTTDAGDDIICDCANWANARLIADASMEVLPPGKSATPLSERVDVAPFGQIMTWDPAREDGARCARTEPFPAEDLFLGRDLAPDADGSVEAPVWPDGRRCIGLRWIERRRLDTLLLQFAQQAAPAMPDSVQVQT
jgi:NPCBM/NEW2 domain-containing protein